MIVCAHDSLRANATQEAASIGDVTGSRGFDDGLLLLGAEGGNQSLARQRAPCRGPLCIGPNAKDTTPVVASRALGVEFLGGVHLHQNRRMAVCSPMAVT